MIEKSVHTFGAQRLVVLDSVSRNALLLMQSVVHSFLLSVL